LLRHLLILTSTHPNFFHSNAARTVAALIAEEMRRLVARVTICVCCAPDEASEKSVERLGSLDIRTIVMRARRVPSPQIRSKIDTLTYVAKSLMLNDGTCDYPRPDNPSMLSHDIDHIGADAALLFWDTLAEFSLPQLKTPAFGYLGRPPHASGIARAGAKPSSLRRAVNLALFSASERRHLRRMQTLKASANICALDSAYYNAHGVPCQYISNTWGDPVGADWFTRRAQAEAALGAPQVLGNVGGLNATGNAFGIKYLGREVLPELTRLLPDIAWTISICGGGRLPDEAAASIQHPRVHVKGFVDDIDTEMLSSGVFLLLNNAGPYTGGYTRVIYAFATGACLVAHSNLRHSMPELLSEVNCLLADSPAEIAGNVKRLVEDPELRRKIGSGARRTYETEYAPRHVARKLIDMIHSGLSA
jgi:Glycosyl transferases group 1